MKSKLGRCALCVLWIVVVPACAGMRQYTIGVPAYVAPNFFAHLESVGQARGFGISRHPTSLNLRTPEGDWLQYMIHGEQIDLVLLPNVKGLSEDQIRQRQAQLKTLSDEMVSQARSQAVQTKAFESGPAYGVYGPGMTQ